MLLMGHRGARDQGPENTLKAFKAAVASGLQVVELDIHASKDGVLVVHHDETLDRTTSGRGFLRDRTLLELKELDAGGGESVPTLAEVLEVLLPQGIQVQIELKTSDVLLLLEKEMTPFKDLWPLLTFISFEHSWLAQIKKILPEIKTAGLLFGAPIEVKSFYKAANLDGLSLSIHWINSQICQDVRSLGGYVTCWNANDFLTLQKAYLLKVDHVGTDVPLQATQWLKDLKSGHKRI